MNFEKINFVVHFDVLIEHDITTLRSNWFSEEQIDDVLNTTQLGLVLQRIDNEDGETYFEGDVNLTDPQSYFNLIQGMPTYSVISAAFDGQFVEPILNDWSSIRTWLTELRRRTMPAEGRWGGYTEAPVTISLGFLELSSSEYGSTYLDICSEAKINDFFGTALNLSAKSPSLREFLSYYESEILRFQSGRGSTFLKYWLATELLLTQKELKVTETGDKHNTLVPAYSIDSFEWEKPTNSNLFLDEERTWGPDKAFMFTPVPLSPFHQGSDPDWDYSVVPSTEERVGLNNTDFTKLRFAITLNALRAYIEDYEVADAFFNVGSFYDKYKGEIEEFTDVMRDAFSWDDAIALDGKEAKFVEDMELPPKAGDIWREYLQTILRSPEPITGSNGPKAQEPLELKDSNPAVDYFESRGFTLESSNGKSFQVNVNTSQFTEPVPGYFNIFAGKVFVYVDVPFSRVDDGRDIRELLGEWGIGSWGEFLTLHLTLPMTAFSGDLASTDQLITKLLIDAAKLHG